MSRINVALISILAALVVVGLAVGGWFLYWHLAKAGQANRYEVNVGTQQYQAGLIQQERDRVIAYNIATDPGQKKAIADQFCAIFPSIVPAPTDLVSANASICF
jgi:flagellar basal body-associated protein FliL